MVKVQENGQLYFDFDNRLIDFEVEAMNVHAEYIQIREKMNMTQWTGRAYKELIRRANVLLEVRENLYRMVL